MVRVKTEEELRTAVKEELDAQLQDDLEEEEAETAKREAADADSESSGMARPVEFEDGFTTEEEDTMSRRHETS